MQRPGRRIDRFRQGGDRSDRGSGLPERGTRPRGEGRGRPSSELIQKLRRVRELAEDYVVLGLDPDFFWPPERNRRLDELMRSGRFDEADKLLDQAFADYRAKVDD
jgi:hypothetical protein